MRWVPRLRRQVRGSPRSPQTAEPDTAGRDLGGELETYLAARVREGYETRDEMIQGAGDFLAEEFPTASIELVASPIVDRLLADHAVAEATWDTPTDPDRLSRAFVDLESDGVVARENFADCQTCGFAEISDEVKAVASQRDVRGFAFFHQQDTERAAADGVLYLSFGSVTPTVTDLEIGRDIAGAMSAAGFSVVWDGSVEKRIGISGLDWRRRRSGGLHP